ncbi:MAG: purine-nucleoside phosphorylase [Bacilli bacterium]
MTAHIEAKKEDISNIVIMPGDPLRAKFITENFLTNYKLVNQVRGMLAYTGFYKDTRVTVMASGMGMPSMGIYSYELFKFYDVDYIIRVGSSGSYTKDINLYDIVLAKNCYSMSTYGFVQNASKEKILNASSKLNEIIKNSAEKENIKIFEETIHSSDVFYKENNEFKKLNKEYGCVCVEMESFALFHNANILNKHAACILTISDSLVTKEATTSLERQEKFTEMMKLALNSITNV